MTNGSPFASGALATALEQLESVGVDVVSSRIAETAGALIARLEASGVPVLSPVARAERAGIVVAGVPAGSAAEVGARLEAAGVTATIHGDDRVRFSVHATTTPAALDAAVTVLTAVGTPPHVGNDLETDTVRGPRNSKRRSPRRVTVSLLVGLTGFEPATP